MKIVLFTHVFPYPLNEGGKVAQYSFLESLCDVCEVVLVAENNQLQMSAIVDELKRKLPALKIYTVSQNAAIEPSGMLGMALTVLSKLQWRLNKKVTGKDAPSSKITDNSYFVYPVRARKSEVVDQFAAILQKEKPDIVQIDFIDNADLAGIIPSHIKKVLVHHDLRFTSVLQAAVLEKKSATYANYLHGFTKNIETAFLKEFDAVITFSENDKQKLAPDLPGCEIVTIPFGVSTEALKALNYNEYNIRSLIFIGPDTHFPNYDAVEWYAREMAEPVLKQFRLKLIVVGNWSQANIEKLAREGVEFAGYVNDLQAFTKDTAMIVPLRIGSGIRTKLLDAFAYGVPVISTTLGCEGIGVHDGKEILIADEPEQFIKAIQHIMDDVELVKAMRYNANEYLKEHFSSKKICEKRMAVFKNLLQPALS